MEEPHLGGTRLLQGDTPQVRLGEDLSRDAGLSLLGTIIEICRSVPEIGLIQRPIEAQLEQLMTLMWPLAVEPGEPGEHGTRYPLVAEHLPQPVRMHNGCSQNGEVGEIPFGHDLSPARVWTAAEVELMPGEAFDQGRDVIG